MNRPELETHLQDLFDGCIAAEAFDSLQEELRANPEARAAYREYLHLHHALRFRAKGVDLLRVVPMDKVAERRQRRAVKHAALAAAAVLALVAVAMTLIMVNKESPTLRFNASRGSDLVLSHRVDREKLPPQGQVLEPGSQLILRRGVVELEFESGVRGIIRGPADLTLLREDLLELEEGTVWFEVPGKAVGFQVRTAQLVLTDLGTEFGLVSKPDSLDEVHVFTGKVEVLNRQGLKEQELVTAGQARVADPEGRWKETPVKREAFLDELPDKISNYVSLDDSATFTSSPQNQMIRSSQYVFTSGEALIGFDPGKSDKLVVTLSHERGEISEVTYGGVRMSLAVRSSSSDLIQTAIYYLDSPGVAGDLAVTFNGASNGVGGSVLALANTELGEPASTKLVSGRSLSLTPTSENSFLVFSHAANEHQDQSKASPLPPMRPLFDDPTGSAVGGSGYFRAPGDARPKSVTATFSGKGGSPVTAAAIFNPVP